MPAIPDRQPPLSPQAQAYAAEIVELSTEVRERSKVVLDIPYGPEERQRLDLYCPRDGTSAPVPVLLFMHGGAWRNGCKEWMGFMAPAITCLPAIFMSVGYRLAPASKFPAPLQDCRRALQWAHDNVGGYSGDPDRLFVGGHSAGGHLAAMLALQRDALREHSLPEDAVKGCFPVSGVFDLSYGLQDAVQMLVCSQHDIGAASPINMPACMSQMLPRFWHCLPQ